MENGTKEEEIERLKREVNSLITEQKAIQGKYWDRDINSLTLDELTTAGLSKEQRADFLRLCVEIDSRQDKIFALMGAHIVGKYPDWHLSYFEDERREEAERKEKERQDRELEVRRLELKQLELKLAVDKTKSSNEKKAKSNEEKIAPTGPEEVK